MVAQPNVRLYVKALSLIIAALLFFIGAFAHGSWFTMFSLGLALVALTLVIDDAANLIKTLTEQRASAAPPVGAPPAPPAIPAPPAAPAPSATPATPVPSATPAPAPAPVEAPPAPQPQARAAAPAGWYADPEGKGGQRYWDGSSWTEHRAP